MLWSQNVPATRPHTLSGLVFVSSLLLGVSCVLLGSSDKDCIFNLTFQSFQPILSWEFKKPSVVTTHYTLQYTIMSDRVPMMTVENCENIPRSFCDLSEVWTDMSETYILNLTGFHGNTALGYCMSQIKLGIKVPLEPPEFEILGTTDHITVLLNTTPMATKSISELWLSIPLMLEEQSEGVVKKHTSHINRNKNFTYVIKELIPNTNVCISAYFEQYDFEPDLNIRSPFKCILLPKDPSESSESEKIGGIIFIFLMPVIVICTIMILKRTGYICLRNDSPKVLSFRNFSSWVFLNVPSSEAVDKVEVIIVNRKKKVWNYNYDESDSDTEAAPQPRVGGYTMHGLTGRLLSLAPTSAESPSDPDTEEPDEPDLSDPEADTEPLMVPGPSPWQSECPGVNPESPGNLLQDPLFQETSSSPEGSGSKIVFNVNLNSVCMRFLDDSDVPQMLILPGDTVDLQDPEEIKSSPLVAWGEGAGSFGEASWPGDTSSDTSDSCGSDVDLGSGYLAR